MSLQDLTAVLGVVGGIVLFGFALHQWNDGQQWRRAEKLDAMIHEFDSAPLLVFARVVLDWQYRTVVHADRKVKLTNVDAILALRDHRTLGPDNDEFPGEQALVRDALDCVLTYFERLHVAFSARLVDVAQARPFFRYWLERLVSYDAHPYRDDLAELGGIAKTSADVHVARYIARYSNIDAIIGLCAMCEVTLPTGFEAEYRRLRPGA